MFLSIELLTEPPSLVAVVFAVWVKMWFPVLLLAVLQVVSAAKLMRCGTAQPPQSFIVRCAKS